MKLIYPDNLTIQQYLEGKLDLKKMHQLEKQALDDPFLWEALEGYAYTSDPGADLSILQRQLHERIVHLQENKKVFDLSWQRLSIAAAAAVLFISAGILFWMNSNRSGAELAANHKQVEVSVIDRDSLGSVIASSKNSAAIAEKVGSVPPSDARVAAYNSPEKVNDGSNVGSVSSLLKADPASAETKLSARNSSSLEEQALADPSAALSSVSAKKLEVQPLAGWDTYRKYLEENIRRPENEPVLKGRVVLTFDADPKGRPVNIRVLNGLTKAYDAEAIRLIKDGPDWKMPEGSKNRTTRVEVKF